jgi:hypothetical protein
VVSLLFGTGKPPSRDINSHNSHSTSFQIGDYERVSCCELMSRVVRSVSNKSKFTIVVGQDTLRRLKASIILDAFCTALVISLSSGSQY